MKRNFSALLLSLCLLASILVVPISAASQSSAIQATQALGIISGDDTNAAVTRARFAVMLTAASAYKDSISSEGAGYSLYKDVKSGYWASEYIRLAVQEGWMTGYTDGTFRPDQTVTLEEACTAALRLLGYDPASLAGSFPAAQLSKASALGLRDQIAKQKGQTLTVGDCAQLFYNLLTAKTSSGQVYGTTLGYTITNGEVDYTAIALQNVSGPYVASNSASLPFTPGTIYRDGTLSASASLSRYDVYYYNEGLSTLWIYTDRVSGEITDIAPSVTAPSSVTVAGSTYAISSQEAAYKLSALGGGSTGEIVTLLLGMDGGVVDILTGDAVEQVYYGMVQASSKKADGGSVQTTANVFCTDGVIRSFTVDKAATYRAGQVVAVNISSGGVSIRGLASKSASGTVNNTATKLGNLSFAENVEILDVASEGVAAVIKPSRLAGCTLNESDVRYYGLNTTGEIEYLILNDATGDTWTYGYMTRIEDRSQDMSINVSYTYVIDGVTSTLNSSAKYPVSGGGFAIRYNADGSIKSMRGLQSVKLTSLSLQSAMASNQKYNLADNVQVYLVQNGVYYLTDVSAIDAENYTLTGWYNNFGRTISKQIRVIIAQPQ